MKPVSLMGWRRSRMTYRCNCKDSMTTQNNNSEYIKDKLPPNIKVGGHITNTGNFDIGGESMPAQINEAQRLRDRIELKFLWILHTISDNERKSIEKCIEELVKSEALALLDRLLHSMPLATST